MAVSHDDGESPVSISSEAETFNTEVIRRRKGFTRLDREGLRGATHNAAEFFAQPLCQRRPDRRRKLRPAQRRIDSV
jgi:hypothetical protein